MTAQADIQAGPKFCKRGHPRTPDNTDSHRHCITCRRDQDRARYADPVYREQNRERRWRNPEYRERERLRVLDRYYSDDPHDRLWVMRAKHAQNMSRRRQRIGARADLPRLTFSQIIELAIREEGGLG